MNWLQLLLDPTVQTVALGAAILGIASGVLGSFAVLRRQSLLGDTLSHATLPGICLGFLWAGGRDLGALLSGAFFSGAVSALCVLMISRLTRLKDDAALGIVLSVSFAIGVVLLTHIQSTGAAGQAGLDSFLFGQAAAMLRKDIPLLGGLCLLSLGIVVLLWKELKLTSFDPVFAAVSGLPVLWLEILLTMLLALAIVIGLQLVGVVLMTAMVIAPAAAARQWCRRLESMVWLSAAFGMLAGVSGALVSAWQPGLATGPVIVLVAIAMVLVSLLVAPERGLLREFLQRWHHRNDLAESTVLLTLYRLTLHHQDQDYLLEDGMIRAYHGGGSARAMRALQRKGYVLRAWHPPERTRHWRLTEAGQEMAQAIERRYRPGATSDA